MLLQLGQTSKSSQFGDNIAAMLVEFECYSHPVSSWPQAIDNKALTCLPCSLPLLNMHSGSYHTWHCNIQKSWRREWGHHGVMVALLHYLVEHWLEVTWGCFKSAILTAAVNSIFHLHMKGPVKTKSNTVNKWNGVSFLLFNYYHLAPKIYQAIQVKGLWVSLPVPQHWLNRSIPRTPAHQWIITHRIITLDFTTTVGFEPWSNRSVCWNFF